VISSTWQGAFYKESCLLWYVLPHSRLKASTDTDQIILAIYYTLADIVLLAQCFYYRGFTLRDPKPESKAEHLENGNASERTPLVANGNAREELQRALATSGANGTVDRTRSESSYRDRLNNLNGTMLSPATPMHPQPEDESAIESAKPAKARTWLQAILFNSTAIVLVIIAGIAGYYLSPSTPEPKSHYKDGRTDADDQASTLHFSLWGQIFGYICAALYLGSRVPQILLNRRRQSTEGLNALFFLFACLGNLTFVLSIFAFEPICSKHSHGHWHERSHCKPGEAANIYGKYILVNLSWLIGSAGTLVLDFAVFTQFFMYRNNAAPQKAAATTPADELPRTMDGEGRGREPSER
jgi:solute carrier family 66 (lysosomal lysine-arginine transporter), member 1